MDLTKEPNPPFEIEIIDTKPVEVTNPFSGQKATYSQRQSRFMIASKEQKP